MKRFILSIAVFIAAPSYSETTAEAAQKAINKEGIPCEKVTAVDIIGGELSVGQIFFGVACSNGGRHVVFLDEDAKITYVTHCDVEGRMVWPDGKKGDRCFPN